MSEVAPPPKKRYTRITPEIEVAVEKLFWLGIPGRQIAIALGIGVNTVNQLIAAMDLPSHRERYWQDTLREYAAEMGR